MNTPAPGSKSVTSRRTVPDMPAPGAATSGVAAADPQLGVHTQTFGTPLATPAAASRTETIPDSGVGRAAPTMTERLKQVAHTNGVVRPPAPPSGPPVPDAFALLKALRHRWLLAVSAGLFFAVLASTITWFLLPTTLTLVTATAKLRIKSYEERQFSQIVGSRLDGHTYRRTQSDLIKTRPVLEAALQEPGVSGLSIAKSPNAVDILEQRTKVELHDSSEVADVSMTGDQPAEVTILVNAIVKTYLRLYVDTERDRRLALLHEHERIRDANEKIIADKFNEIHSKKKLGNTEGLDVKQMQIMDNFRQAQTDLREATSKLRKLRLQYEYELARQGQQKKPIKKMADIPQTVIDEEMEKDPDAKKLQNEKNRLENLIAGYKSIANTGERASPLVLSSLRGLEGDLQRVESKLIERKDQLLPRIKAKLGNVNVAPEETNQTVEQLKVEVKQWEQEEAFAKKNYEDLLKQVQTFYGKSTAELEALMKEIDRLQDITKWVTIEVEALKLEMSSPPRVQLIQEARQPEPRDPHRQTKTVILAGLSAFMFVGFCTAWLEFRSQRLHASDEVINALGMRLLGTVPALPELVRRQPLALSGIPDRRLHSLVTESFDGIRTMLLHEARQSPLRTIMIASAVSGEGKTTLSSHLALSLAHAGRRTLLIDCDLVHPTLHHLFGQRIQPGLCEVLRGEADVFEAVIPTEAVGLSLMPAGRFDRTVSQILAQGGIQPLFERLGLDYEFIIIDTCPVLSVANTLLVGQHVDGVVLSILRDVSQVPRVYATYQRLAALGIRVVGCVFNKSRTDDGYYGYYGHEPAAADKKTVEN